MTRPNILFLLSDQHSSRFTGYAGNPGIRTPHLDRLAREGVIFEQAYCQSPLCCPSRASLLTGAYCRDLGIYDNQHILESNSLTFPRVLARAGYRTAVIGKTHLNGEQFQGYGERPYGDLFGQAHQPDPGRIPGRGDSGLGGVIEAAGPSGIPLPLTQTEICVAEAAKWLQTAGLAAQPFCLSVHFDKPHFPLCPPAAYFNHYDGRVHLPDVPSGSLEREVPFVRSAARQFGIGAPEGIEQRAAQERALAAYCGCVEWVDDAVGRLLGILNYLGLAETTLVVYSSDHGEMAGEHGLWQKSVFYDASARVPLLMRLPGVTGGGNRRVSTPVGLIDLFPTFCELAHTGAPQHCSGVSLLPLLGPDPVFQRDAIFSESVVLNCPEDAGCMIRTGSWKYNAYLDGAEELYDLETDPFERSNLAALPGQAAVRDNLRRRVLEFWDPARQLARFHGHPRSSRAKHWYEFSNQFVLGGAVIDARP